MAMGADRGRPDPDQSLFERWVDDGRSLLAASAGALVFAGGFAIFLALTRELLPHDVHYLGMTADDLCRVECRIVDFMVHDRAAFGGTLVGVGVLYLWLISFPLTEGERWAWWTLVISGSVGFATFLAYLGYGYLDTWHGIGTLALLPVFSFGLVRARRLATLPVPDRRQVLSSLTRSYRASDLGRLVLILGAAGTLAAGLVILALGVTNVFVPEDLHFIGLGAEEVRRISPRLVPLIAHDRAGFGGGVATMGLTTVLCLLFARPSRSLFQAIGLAGALSLTAAFAIHFAVGYNDPWHLAPPTAAAASLVVGEWIVLSSRRDGATPTA